MQIHQPSNAPFPDAAPKLMDDPFCIVCGTDFSDPATKAADVAAALAMRLREPLVLVHTVNGERQRNLPGELRDSLCLYARAQLHEEQERVRTSQMELVEVLRTGAPHAVLLEEATARHARLLVLAASRRRPLSRWLLGSVAEQTAEIASLPTLIVRDAEPLLRWARGEQRLRVFVSADFSGPSEAALRWVEWLRRTGSCDVVVTHLEPRVWPYPVAGLSPLSSTTVR